MANQPPARPWFRLPNLARQQPPPPAPAPAPARAPAPVAQPPQQTRIPVIRPAFRPAFTQSQVAPPPRPTPQYAPPTVTPSPAPTQPPSPPSPPMQTASPSPSPSPSPPPPPPPRAVASPPPPPPPRSYVTSSPPPSTRISQLPSPIASPIKTTRSPPPINLPSPQFNNSTLPEAEQEKVLLQDTFNKKSIFPTSNQDSSIKGLGHKGVHNSSKNGRVKEAAGARKSLSSDSEDGNKNVRIITMSGENKGALMELGFSPRRNEGRTLGNFPGSGHKLGSDDLKEGEDLDSGNADLSKMKDHGKEMETPSRKPMNGYVNSNVQGINNSMLFNCSFTHHDPGVHFSVSRKKPINGKAHHGNEHENGKRI